MKVNEVPQDEAFLVDGKVRDVCYVLDENGNYVQALSKGWAPKNEAIKLAWETIYVNAADCREKIISGELSPIAFYMTINAMDVDILANYMGYSGRKVRKHLKMKVFKNLNADVIAEYADVFGLRSDQLLSIEFLKNVNLDGENKLSA